jgi:hypothetical protein
VSLGPSARHIHRICQGGQNVSQLHRRIYMYSAKGATCVCGRYLCTLVPCTARKRKEVGIPGLHSGCSAGNSKRDASLPRGSFRAFPRDVTCLYRQSDWIDLRLTAEYGGELFGGRSSPRTVVIGRLMWFWSLPGMWQVRWAYDDLGKIVWWHGVLHRVQRNRPERCTSGKYTTYESY